MNEVLYNGVYEKTSKIYGFYHVILRTTPFLERTLPTVAILSLKEMKLMHSVSNRFTFVNLHL